ncbi:MAG: sulfotransferase [Ectothiorhodospiraceae bacterium]|nr:sulfotransferase [Ectothiorhodospiraceae bacterium]
MRRARALIALASEHQERGDLDGACEALLHALHLAPRHTGVLHELARLHHLRGDDAQAALLMARLVALVPDDPTLHNDLGNLRLAVGDLPAALAAYERALVLAPDRVDTLYNMAIAMVRAGRPTRARELLERAIELSPTDPAVWTELGKVRIHLHDTQSALGAFQRALALDSGSADACCGLATVAMTRGDGDAARRWLREALARDAGHAIAWHHLARAGDRPSSGDDVARVEAALAGQSDPDLASSLEFALAKMHDDLGDAERAFRHLRAGNQQVRAREHLDRVELEERVERIVETFTPGYFSAREGLGSEATEPVLVAGAPRSGTTLVEQIIASHPRCAGLGESARLDALIARAPGTRSRRDVAELGVQLDAVGLSAMARDYLDFARARCPSATRIADKTPSIVFQLGLLAVLFPRATLVHCARDPLDTGLSIYFQRFADGTLPWAYDLEDIGVVLRAVRRLMAHWHRVLPGRIHTVQYEALIRDQEPVSRRLIAHCGLDWDQRCLAFHTTRREVHTASAWQVRRPIYATSVGRARAYRQYLGPLEAALRGDDSPLDLAEPPPDPA